MALSQLLPEIPGNHSPRCSLPVGFLLQDHTWDPGCEVQGIVLQRFRICRCRQCCFAVLFFSDSKKRRERRGRCSSNLKEETRNYIKYLNLIYIYISLGYLSIYIFFFQIVSSFKDHNSRPNYHFCWVRWRFISLGTSTNRGFLKWGATPETPKTSKLYLNKNWNQWCWGFPISINPHSYHLDSCGGKLEKSLGSVNIPVLYISQLTQQHLTVTVFVVFFEALVGSEDDQSIWGSMRVNFSLVKSQFAY